MNAVNRVWSVVEVYVQALSFLLALFCVFTFAAPQANAATDVSAQSGAFVNAGAYLDHLISDMGLGAQVLAEVFVLPHAQTAAAASASALTSAQVSAILSLLSSFGADQKTISNVELALQGGSKQEIRQEIRKEMAGPGATGSTSPAMPHEKEFKEKPALPPATSACAVFARTIKKGAVGEDVALLQKILKELGDLKEASTTTYFGPSTEAALKQWQTRMNVVTSGDADTTGFGSVGPKTREALSINCKGSNGNATSTLEQKERFQTNTGTSTPVCMLKANKTSVASGTSVVLSWESKNAAYAGSATGAQMPPFGSVTVNPTETTTYQKTVYGPGGTSTCQAIVEVVGSQPTATPVVKVVWNPLSPVAHLLSTMQVGAVVLAEGYNSLVGQH